MDPFRIVKDSSIWKDDRYAGAVYRRDPFIRVGTIKRIFYDKRVGDFRYQVELIDKLDIVDVNARLMTRFGGVYNYEEFTLRGYKSDRDISEIIDLSIKPGDLVVVVFINGNSSDALIIGAIRHRTREHQLKAEDGPQYKSEFNGIETFINKDGEYRLTFLGQPTNLSKLNEKPSKQIDKPQRDKNTTGSYVLMDKTGSIEINDVSTKDGGNQMLRIDKTGGTIKIKSGSIDITLTKKQEKIDVSCKTVDIKAKDLFTVSTKDTSIKSSSSVKINSPKIAIGKNGVELLDQIFQLVEAIGMLTPISPMGPCTAMQAAPQWSQVKQVQQKIKEITGSL